ncbi:contractile injection system tape measure protein [Pseudaquabacterium pictum]|uniref:Uncharacterized protein n=1 Tax=Pseudaquabacterium pictum TaxID=2315236 RepID=A0A480AIW0_9BURK|nr:contractile injection system tape measure protein [Rubrivivax pictus]GCL60936.1 hypothetical protein AQPW35_00170 [Rubrivivax pictus]
MPASAPPHRVQRLLVDLVGMPRDQAPALQAAAQRQLQQHLLPALERLCDQLGDARLAQRIDRLTIDLGAWPAAAWQGDDAAATQALQAAFVAEVTQQLRQALPAAAAVQTDAELVASCLHTGQLPWWADSADRGLLQRALATLLAGPLRPGLSWLPPADADAPALQRLVAALDDAALARLVSLLHGEPAAPAPDWDRLWPAMAAPLGRPRGRLRQAWWREALAAALRPGGQASPWARALQRLPGRLGLASAVLAPAWRRALDQAAPGDDPATVATLWQALDQAWPAGHPVDLPQDADDALAALARLAAALASRPAGDADRAWLPWLDQLRRHPQPAASGRLAQALASARPHASDLAAISAALQAWLATIAPPPGADGPAPPAGTVSPASTTAAAALAALLDEAARQPGAAPTVAPSPAPSLATADALYPANAGLVLLWPFLQRFADRLGLLQARQFRSPAHAVRLAVLLQCLATGDADPPEYQLPLNKLLCGLPLDAPILLDDPITADEQDECTALLAAVVQAAPVLRQMSPDGLRQAFLQRPGQLRTQDGHWLLQVERATHDVVMDRFPWSPAIVRLPWMPRLLQVQW